MKNELSKPPSKPWAVMLPPKTEIQKRLKEHSVELCSFLKESTVTIEEIEDSQPTLALSGKEISKPTHALEDAVDDKDSEDETDVEEPPSCPVDLMNSMGK